MLHLLQMGPFKVLTSLFFQIQYSRQLSLLGILSMLRPGFFWISHTYQNCDFFLGPLQLVYLNCNTSPTFPPMLMQHSRPTLAFKPLIPPLPTLHLLPPYSHHRLMLSDVFLYILLPLPREPLRVLRWNAGGLRSRSTELLHVLSSHPVDLICIQESNLHSSSSFEIPGFSARQSDRTHSRSGIFSLDITHASGGVIFFVRQGSSFSQLYTSFLSSLNSYSDFVEFNISLNNSSSLLFLNDYDPPICSSPTDSRTDSFSSSILPSSRNLFLLGDFNCHHPL